MSSEFCIILLFVSFSFIIRGLLLPFRMNPTTKRFSSFFFVTILLPSISNMWVFLLKINLLCYCVYNMWQNIINSYQLWKKRKNEMKN